MRHSEALAAAYFGYLAVVAMIQPLPVARRARVWAAAAAAIVAELLLLRLPQPLGDPLRDWFPALMILLGYFATGAFFVAPSRRVEAWLRRWDERWIRDPRFTAVPPIVRAYLDVVYDLTFLLIPGGFAVLAWTGHRRIADHYWTVVTLAEFIPFGTLPWMQARPPWAVEPRPKADAVRAFSLFWVNHTSIRANTFPSGHASATAAVALVVLPVAPVAGAILAALALSIAIGSVVGRFHYAIDAVTGILLALAVWGAAALAGV